MNNVMAIILAAGNSSRMKSHKSKVLHEIGHMPLICYVLSIVKDAVVVLSPDSKNIQDVVSFNFPQVSFAIQDQPLGTGHGVMAGLNSVSDAHQVLILYGDTPLLTQETIDALSSSTADCTLLAMTPQNPAPYGRMLTDSSGHVLKIIESLDATDDERKINLCFGGCMMIKAALLKTFLPQVGNDNRKKEYYLTTLIELLTNAGHHVQYITTSEEELMGVNTREELSRAEKIFQTRMRQKALNAGVTLEDPSSVFFSYDTQLDQDVVVEPHVYFGPKVKVASGSWIRAFSYIDGANIGHNCIVGPFARIRPTTIMEEKSRVGNFVEVKNATLQAGAKANHLSYIGDAKVGQRTNIGAGTITCNYDGFAKNITTIGNDVFIGSNTSLVAPVCVEDGSIVGAGSVITKTVFKDSIAIARSTQKEIKDGAKIYRKKRT